MNVGSNVVKITAKTALRDNKLKVIFASLALVLSCMTVNVLASILSVVFNNAVAMAMNILLFLLLVFPLSLGLLRFLWRLLFDAEDSPITVFYYFSNKHLYLKVIRFLLLVFVKSLPVIIILYLPVLFVWIFSKGFIFEIVNVSIPLWSTNLGFAIGLLRVLATVVLTLYLLKFYLAPMLIVADEDMDIAEALNMSAIISKKTTLDFISLFFSLSGWIVLSVLFVPIPYALPFILVCYAIHSRFAVAEYNMHIKKKSENSFPTFESGI